MVEVTSPEFPWQLTSINEAGESACHMTAFSTSAATSHVPVWCDLHYNGKNEVLRHLNPVLPQQIEDVKQLLLNRLWKLCGGTESHCLLTCTALPLPSRAQKPTLKITVIVNGHAVALSLIPHRSIGTPWEGRRWHMALPDTTSFSHDPGHSPSALNNLRLSEGETGTTKMS